jgi:hypothetical protein
MYMQPEPRRAPAFGRAFSISWVAALSAVGVVVLGLFPTPVLTAAQAAILNLVR